MGSPALPRVVRGQGPAVPQGRRLLRLRAAVHPVPPGLAVRGAGRGADRHDRAPLPQRRNPAPGLQPAGGRGGEDPHLGPARRPGPHQRRRVLLRPLRTGAVEVARRQRGHCDQRPRQPARVDVADRYRGDRRRSVPVQHPAKGMDPANRGGGAVAPGRHPGRRGLSGALPGPAGQPVGTDQRNALHPAQHRCHPGRLRAQQRPGGEHL